jgi:hypothetical protein
MIEPEIDFGFAGSTCKLHKVPKTFGRHIERFLLKGDKTQEALVALSKQGQSQKGYIVLNLNCISDKGKCRR